ncbi:hypothetical protein PISMIDRAFT_673248 [Pisolithus microcarpus 441]|uniref:C2H2-type domain-containing protein n=1 Tax=Pisolithus microcarpus 441 TaxID=765257 RepID=A0A0C9YVA8_9AGAM|nr:hypothetical protein BKA83DRAFT_673248 [Pisolithus microcarpus]KIK28955.1 hypothetical protein PISMIDRAFT_673248 [Pisolithus microcarpus 441]
MPVNSIPSIHISAATDAYQIPPPSHYSSDSETTMCSEGRVVATPSISQSSEAFDPYCHDGFGLDDLINSGLYGTSTKDDCIYPGIHFHSEDRGEAMDSQSNAFDGERLGSDLCYMSGPLNAHSFAAGLADIRYLAPSPSPSSSCNGSQSPASVHSELSSDNDHLSPISFTTEDSITYPTSPCLTGYHGHHPYSRPRHMSSESVTTSDLTLPPRVLGHHRSHSTPSAPRPCIATQAMLHANERRRKHEAQFSCGECQQTFTAQFSLKRHQQSHTGERRFKCGIPGCTQTFFNNSDCKRHEKSKKRHPNLV